MRTIIFTIQYLDDSGYDDDVAKLYLKSEYLRIHDNTDELLDYSFEFAKEKVIPLLIEAIKGDVANGTSLSN